MIKREQEQPAPDRSEDDEANLDELSFSDDRSEPPPQEGADPDGSINQAGLTGAAIPGDAVTEDDMAPETLFDEDGVQAPDGTPPTDQQLREVGIDEIGAGEGLDEAELGRLKPLDNKPWNGDPSEPLSGGPTANDGFPTAEQEPEREIEEEEET